jgi:hypothetical protein
MLTTAERVMVVWTSSLVAVNAAAGHPGTTDAQHSTCRVPQCHQCVPEQTSTTHRPKRPLVFQPTQRPHAALCCMRKHSTHPSTSTVLSALCLRQRAPQHQHPHHIVYKSSPSASTTVPAPPKHTRPVPDLCRVVERPPRRHLSPPPQKGCVDTATFPESTYPPSTPPNGSLRSLRQALRCICAFQQGARPRPNGKRCVQNPTRPDPKGHVAV